MFIINHNTQSRKRRVIRSTAVALAISLLFTVGAKPTSAVITVSQWGRPGYWRGLTYPAQCQGTDIFQTRPIITVHPPRVTVSPLYPNSWQILVYRPSIDRWDSYWNTTLQRWEYRWVTVWRGATQTKSAPPNVLTIPLLDQYIPPAGTFHKKYYRVSMEFWWQINNTTIGYARNVLDQGLDYQAAGKAYVYPPCYFWD